MQDLAEALIPAIVGSIIPLAVGIILLLIYL
jgi:hypothetical protein